MVQAVEIPATPALQRPIGRPVAIWMSRCLFAQITVAQLVEKVLAQVVPPPKAKKQYKKWELQHQQMVLDIAEEKGFDRLAVAVLRESFPKVYGSLLESHIRSFCSQAKNCQSGRTAGRTALVIAPLCMTSWGPSGLMWMSEVHYFRVASRGPCHV